MTFTDELSVHFGGKADARVHFGRGHTNGDAIIYFPEDRSSIPAISFSPASAAADARSGGKPPARYISIDYAQGGSFLDWSGTLDGALKLDFDTVIPGHGPLPREPTS